MKKSLFFIAFIMIMSAPYASAKVYENANFSFTIASPGVAFSYGYDVFAYPIPPTPSNFERYKYFYHKLVPLYPLINRGHRPPIHVGHRPPIHVGHRPPIHVGHKPPIHVGHKPPIHRPPRR